MFHNTVFWRGKTGSQSVKNQSCMIQRSYLIWYKHKSYFRAHWQLFLFRIHTYSIVWYILQMALFLFCKIINYGVKTDLWYRDLVKTSRPKPKISKFVNFAKDYHHFGVEFFQIFGIFPICFSCFLLSNTTEKNLLNYRSFLKPYPFNIDSFKIPGLWPRTETFKPETETRIYGLNQISRLHHCK